MKQVITLLALLLVGQHARCDSTFFIGPSFSQCSMVEAHDGVTARDLLFPKKSNIGQSLSRFSTTLAGIGAYHLQSNRTLGIYSVCIGRIVQTNWWRMAMGFGVDERLIIGRANNYLAVGLEFLVPFGNTRITDATNHSLFNPKNGLIIKAGWGIMIRSIPSPKPNGIDLSLLFAYTRQDNHNFIGLGLR